jgi:hypothetical protein
MRSLLSVKGVSGSGPIATAVLLIFIVLAFGLTTYPSEPLYTRAYAAVTGEEEGSRTFTLTIDSKQVVVRLPDTLPDMANAEYAFEECFNLIACRQRYCLHGDVLSHELHDHVDFLYTNKAEAIALVWVRTIERIYVAWKYVDGVPVLADIEDINKLIRDIAKPKESSFMFESRPIPLFVSFTFEGELDPDVLDDWSVIRTQPDPRGIVWIFWWNPDPDSPIRIVVGEVGFDGTLIMYRYFKNGAPHMFYLDKERGGYVRYRFTDGESAACMKCHRDKIEEPAILDEIRLNRIVFR